VSHLLTDWLCIATEGDTVDERKIYRQWIIDMGETYNFNHYGARIWPEHTRDWGSFGEVRDVMWQDGEDGLARLYAKISPNMNLIYANREGQMVYFSIEPEENWRGSGKTYLKGLAVTDRPASIGTTRLQFSQRNLSKQGYYACAITSDRKFKQEKVMKTPWQNYFGLKPKVFEETTEDTPTGDDKLAALAEAVNDIETQVGLIAEQVQAVTEAVDKIKTVIDTQEFADLRANIGNVISNMSKLDKTVTNLPQRKFGDQGKEKTEFKFL